MTEQRLENILLQCFEGYDTRNVFLSPSATRLIVLTEDSTQEYEQKEGGTVVGIALHKSSSSSLASSSTSLTSSVSSSQNQQQQQKVLFDPRAVDVAANAFSSSHVTTHEEISDWSSVAINGGGGGGVAVGNNNKQKKSSSLSSSSSSPTSNDLFELPCSSTKQLLQTILSCQTNYNNNSNRRNQSNRSSNVTASKHNNSITSLLSGFRNFFELVRKGRDTRCLRFRESIRIERMIELEIWETFCSSSSTSNSSSQQEIEEIRSNLFPPSPASPSCATPDQIHAWLCVVDHYFSSFPEFRFPVADGQAPGYRKLVKQPMSLTTMMIRIRCGFVIERKHFSSLLDLIANNCRKYNGDYSALTRRANAIAETSLLRELASLYVSTSSVSFSKNQNQNQQQQQQQQQTVEGKLAKKARWFLTCLNHGDFSYEFASHQQEEEEEEENQAKTKEKSNSNKQNNSKVKKQQEKKPTTTAAVKTTTTTKVAAASKASSKKTAVDVDALIDSETSSSSSSSSGDENEDDGSESDSSSDEDDSEDDSDDENRKRPLRGGRGRPSKQAPAAKASKAKTAASKTKAKSPQKKTSSKTSSS